MALRGTQNTDNYSNSTDLMPEIPLSTGKDDSIWSNRIKKRELLLDDVGGPPLSSSTKGKRSERDRDGKGQGQASSRTGTNKIGRPSISNTKGERKTKTKPRQKTTPVFNILDQSRTSSFSKSNEATNNNNNNNNNNNGVYSNLEALDDSDPIDLSHLQIPDGLGGPDDFDTQAGDLSSWLNIDDDALQDNDLLGLQIPMDDLSDLNMMV